LDLKNCGSFASSIGALMISENENVLLPEDFIIRILYKNL